ncbi:PREDICTED: digestive organ expansion factor homolog [Condylura cristata]|uniref:digestive organ expansion factor homolog n=1 Tax=Condylura cristata TaxID=143302 RepID=UPI000643550E|nr:PREDICTED: digestive organ expansion factor homolog [Condylura cristata]
MAFAKVVRARPCPDTFRLGQDRGVAPGSPQVTLGARLPLRLTAPARTTPTGPRPPATPLDHAHGPSGLCRAAGEPRTPSVKAPELRGTGPASGAVDPPWWPCPSSAHSPLVATGGGGQRPARPGLGPAVQGVREGGDPPGSEPPAWPPDPFFQHVNRELKEKDVQAAATNPRTTQQLKWPVLGQVVFSTKFETLETFRPPKEVAVESLHLQKPLDATWPTANGPFLAGARGPFTPRQRELFAAMSAYRDVLFPERGAGPAGEEVRLLYCLHALNHVLKANARVLANNGNLFVQVRGAGREAQLGAAAEAAATSAGPERAACSVPRALCVWLARVATGAHLAHRGLRVSLLGLTEE